MKRLLPAAGTLGVLVLAFAPALLAGQEAAMGHTKELVVTALPAKSGAKLTVTSHAFTAGGEVPYENTQYRGNIFPGLAWTKGPQGTKSYVVIVQGTSLNRNGASAGIGGEPAGNGGNGANTGNRANAGGGGGSTSIHLTLFNIPANVTALKAGMTDPPAGSTYGQNIHGINHAYAGPHTHTSNPNGYHYQVFALDSALDLPPATDFNAMVDAMTGHVLASGDLMGQSARDPQSDDKPISAGPIKIETGLISGAPGKSRGIMVYKGVPYATPPVGDLRYAAPKPPIAWDGVRKADQFGAVCPQGGPNNPNAPKPNMSEDCLFANVWTSAASSLEKRPVYVWIYGGGFTGGSGSEPQYDGEALAKKGLVVVTFNYRLGSFGFLATPELSKESGHNASGNFGLQDDIALLQWVHRNIAAFGGDPDRVTIGGWSAGAGSTGFMDMSPLAKGLFLRSIQESHARYDRDTELRYLATSYRTLQTAEQSGLKFQEEHGAHSIKELRALPWQDLVVKGMGADDSVETGSDNKPPVFRPVIDGYVLPNNYEKTFAQHLQNDVAAMAGNNRDESGASPEPGAVPAPGAGAGGPGGPRRLTVDRYVAAAKRKFGPLADEYLKLYPATTDEEAALANSEAVRDNSRISTWLWAVDFKKGTDKPVYNFFFTHRPTGDRAGAHHGAEIIFAFDNLEAMPPRDATWTDEDRKVADTMSSYWANYIATGNPNAPGLAEWPAFDPKKMTVMEIGDHFAPTPIASSQARFDFWKKFFQTQPAW
jgi:para-nitrobenzyl esterase